MPITSISDALFQLSITHGKYYAWDLGGFQNILCKLASVTPTNSTLRFVGTLFTIETLWPGLQSANYENYNYHIFIVVC